MTPPPLHALDAASTLADEWWAAMGSALAGSGPALLPLPAGPADHRRRLLSALRPDDVQAPLEEPAGGRVALVVPTSGSSGPPKGTLLTAQAVTASATATAARLSGPGQWVLALPLTHVAGLMVVARSVLAGTRPVPTPGPNGFDVEAFAAATAQAHRRAEHDGLPLYVSLVPTQLARLLTAGVDLAPYAAVLLGGAAAPADLLDRARGQDVPLVVTYGMTETCGGCVYDGRPLDGVTVAVERGRVLLGGTTLFSGYRLRADLTAAAVDAAGRLVSGDLGAITADGHLVVRGRADDLIVSGGENVPPGRVEEVLGALDGVTACAVVGIPDAEWGERVVAVLAMDAQATAPALDEVRSAGAGSLPRAWLPREVVVLDALPMLPSGKVDRLRLRTAVATAGRT
jgi:O-succinylbenzoic acid--CoA ligase